MNRSTDYKDQHQMNINTKNNNLSKLINPLITYPFQDGGVPTHNYNLPVDIDLEGGTLLSITEVRFFYSFIFLHIYFS